MSNKSSRGSIAKQHPLGEHTGPAPALPPQVAALANENGARAIFPPAAAAPRSPRGAYQLHGAVVLLPAPQHHAHGPAGTCRGPGLAWASAAGGVGVRPCRGRGAGTRGRAVPRPRRGRILAPLGAGVTPGPGRGLAQGRGHTGSGGETAEKTLGNRN